MAQQKQRTPRRGGIFPALAVILFLVTVIGFFSDMDPEKELLYAWENTADAIAEEEETFDFLKNTLLLGEAEIRLDGESIDYLARLPEEARLSFGGEGYEASLTSKGDSLVLSSAELSDGARQGARQKAAASFFSSAYLESGALSEEMKTALGLYLALTDPDFISFGEKTEETAQSLWAIADPSCKRKSATITVGEEERKVKDVVYTLDTEDLKKIWTLFCAEGKKEDFQNSVVAAFSAASALDAKALTVEKEEAIRACLRGEGEVHRFLGNLFLSQNSVGKLNFHIHKGYVIGVTFTLKDGDTSVQGDLFFGEEVSADEEKSLFLSAQRGEETLFSARFSSRVTENSDNAFIREWTWELSDPKSVFLTEQTETAGKIRYSWGKIKKDIGLRFISDDREITFGGTLLEYKAGKKCIFELRRMEIERKNLLQGKRLSVSLTPGADGIAMPEAALPLFPEGEEKETLKQSFLEKYNEVVK